jgi:DNA polymerase III epsilon subunit-like protein
MVNMPSAERVVVLDTETTGLSASDRIVEIAAIEVEPRTGRLGPAVHRRVNPGKPIPRAATRIHGIRDADVRDEPPFAALAGEFSPSKTHASTGASSTANSPARDSPRSRT